MDGKLEKLPLAKSNSNHFTDYHTQNPSTSYGVLELGESNNYTETRSKSLWSRLKGIDTTPLLWVIGLVAGIVLIISLSLIPVSDGASNSTDISASLKAAPSHLSQSASHVDIEIPQGRLRGYTKVSRQGREYSAFYKVPYASPPLRSLRFKDPQPPLSWQGLRDNPVVAPQCIQKEKYATFDYSVGVEDCLYANIYTPRLPKSRGSSAELLPTMVYIHGGGHSNGNGSRYGADYFMDEDVVLITFQFRLGAFGFLNTGDDVIHGNMGLKDQVEMLKWVKDNVEYFNGDPNRVTIFGNSRGGMCVGHVLVSPLSKGLFHRAIIISQSGTTLCDPHPPSINEVSGKQTMNQMGRLVGCESGNSQKFWECLIEKDANDIALAVNSKTVYGVTIENGEGREESSKFMPETPYKILQEGKFNAVPFLSGNTNAEWLGKAVDVLLDEDLTKDFNERFEEVGATYLEADLDAEELGRVKQFYFGEEKIENRTLEKLSNMMSDKPMVHCVYTTARFVAKKANAWMYWITKPPYLSYIDKNIPGFPAKELGFVTHADELQFFFLYDGYPEISKDDQEYFEYSKYLVKLWANFARTGNAAMDGMAWPPVPEYGKGYANSTYWLELTDNPVLITTLQERMAFWDNDEFTHKKLLYDWNV